MEKRRRSAERKTTGYQFPNLPAWRREYPLDNALGSVCHPIRRGLEKHEDLGQTIFFGKELIEAMLTHEWLYIYYIGNENSDDIKDRLHGAHLALDLFHKQYQDVKNKINLP